MISDADAKLRRTSGITPAQCAEIRTGIAKWGIVAVLIGAHARGYTGAQIAYARRACHV